jgi:hypothetical protein
MAAILKVKDQKILKEWSSTEMQAAIRQSAVSRIVDDHFLLGILPLEPSASVRRTIIETLHEKDSLQQVALSAYHHEDRTNATDRLGPLSNELLTAQNSLAERIKDLKSITDPKQLLDVALTADFDVLRSTAALLLTDLESLELLAKQSQDREILRIVLGKINDQDALNRISKTPESDSAMRLASAQKSGAETWSSIFDVATNRSATSQGVGDAIAAVSLFPSLQSDAKSSVQQGCLNLIRLGDESRIPEMVDLLEGYGDKILAEDYINCGQPDLGMSARKWASARGYSISTGSGSNRATWGRGK